MGLAFISSLRACIGHVPEVLHRACKTIKLLSTTSAELILSAAFKSQF